MKLEHQVCTFEQAKELKKLGVELESCFAWLEEPEARLYLYSNINKADISIPAYTCAEVGLWIPKSIDIQKDEPMYECTICWNNAWFLVYYYSEDEGTPLMYMTQAKHEAHAKTGVIIKLLKNKIIKAENFKLEPDF